MKNNSIASRNSSLELLRIICMFMIIAHHYFIHGNIDVPTYDTLTVGYVFLQTVSLFGRSACSVFALISGFFLIQSSGQKHYRRIVPMIAQMFFYSILILALLYPLNVVSISWKDLIKSLFPIIWGNWYVVYYCLFYLFVPFINRWIYAMDRAQYQKLLLITIIIWSVIPTFTAKAWGFDNLIFFFVMYLIGAYIKLYVHGKTTYKNAIHLYVALASALLMALSVVAFDGLGYFLKLNLFIEKATYFGEYNTVLSLIFAISLFLYFSNKRFSSKIVNTVAASTMGIYLIHDNGLLNHVLWGVISPNNEYVSFPYVHIVIKVVAVFWGCFAIDWIRKHTVGKWFETWFFKHCDGWVERFQKRWKKLKAHFCEGTDPSTPTK